MYEKILLQLTNYNILYDTGKLNPNASKIISSNEELYNDIVLATSFLPEQTAIRERLYCITHNIISRVLCPTCATPLSIKASGRLEYPKYCSRACAYASPIRTEKKDNTMMQRYGAKYTAQNSELHAKMKKTCVEKYGVDNPFKDPTTQQQIKDTVDEKYGVSNVMHDDNIAKTQKQACQQKDFTTINKKIRSTTYDNNGYYHIRQKHLSEDQILLLNNADWLYHKHYVEKLTLGEIADEIGVEGTVISHRFSLFDIDVQRFAWSVGEKQVMEFFNDLGVEVIQGNRTILSGLELDLYIPKYNIAIEYCGLYWHADCHARIDKHYHSVKHKKCEEQGIMLITIFEDEWRKRKKQVQAKLLSLIGMDDRPLVYARNTSIDTVSTADKTKFFDDHHIQGSGPGSINHGLIYNGDLVACISFIKQTNKYYLNRYATSHRVVGGFSKLLAHFKREYPWNVIVSFADLRWSDGSLYDKTGWELNSTIPPDYYYSPNGHDRYHKFNYRRKYLSKKLKQYDPSLSERENCDNNGILRIWDCGKLRYVLYNH